MIIHFCGCNQAHKEKIMFAAQKNLGIYLFLLIKSPARFFLNGQAYIAKPNDILLYKKGTYQYYEVIEDVYIDDFIFFDCSSKEDEAFMDRLSLKYDQLLNLPNPLSLINIQNNIVTEYYSYHPHRDEMLDLLMKYFLLKLSEAMNPVIPDHNLLESFNDLRTLFYTDPGRHWTLKEMAVYVNLSVSYMEDMYKKIFNTSCMADLIASRMSYARELLITTNLPVNEIAEKCGYDSNAYFSKYFKQVCDMSPSEYRKKYHV